MIVFFISILLSTAAVSATPEPSEFKCELNSPSPPAITHFQGARLSPKNTPDNGRSCGRVVGASPPNGYDGDVPCPAAECLNVPGLTEKVLAYKTWSAYRTNVLEKNIGPLLARDFNLTKVCANAAAFSAEEKKLLLLDLLRLTSSYESDYRSLMAYDDKVNGKVTTGRGMFSVSADACPNLLSGGSQDSYCRLHDPEINAKCAFGVIMNNGGKGAEITSVLAKHWGVWRTDKRNPEGGRLTKILKAFGENPACKSGTGEARTRYSGLENWPKKESPDPKLPVYNKPKYVPDCDTKKIEGLKDMASRQWECLRCWIVKKVEDSGSGRGRQSSPSGENI